MPFERRVKGVGGFFSRAFAGGGGQMCLDNVGMKGPACFVRMG